MGKKPERIRPYLVDRVLPIGSVNVIAGASATQKSRFLYQAYKDWAVTGRVWGRRALRNGKQGKGMVTVLHYVCDRMMVGMLEHMEVGGVDEDELIKLGLDLRIKGKSAEVEVDLPAKEEVADVDLLTIDGFDALVPEGRMNEYRVMRKLMNDIERYAVENRLCVLIVWHISKTVGRDLRMLSLDELRCNLRQMMMGSVAAAGSCDTFIGVVRRGEADDPHFAWCIDPRTYKGFALEYALDEKGRFVPYEDNELSQSAELLRQKLEEELKGEGEFWGEFSTARVIEVGVTKLHYARRSVERALTYLEGRGQLIKVRQGHWMFPGEGAARAPFSVVK